MIKFLKKFIFTYTSLYCGLVTYHTYLHTNRTYQKSRCLVNTGFCQPMYKPSSMLKEYCVCCRIIYNRKTITNTYSLVTHLDVCIYATFCLFQNFL